MSEKVVLTEQQLEYIKRGLLNKVPKAQLARELDIGKTPMDRIAKELMGEDFNFYHKSYFDSFYFNELDTPEKAYWVGFIAADGSVTDSLTKSGQHRRTLTIKLKYDDIGHLEKFNKAITGNFTIREIRTDTNKLKNCHQCCITIGSKDYIEALKKYGVAPNKSLTFYPINIPKELFSCWILGYMDGDGSIYRNKRKYNNHFTGSYNTMSIIKEYFNSTNKIELEHRCENTFRFRLECQKSIDFLKQIEYTKLSFCLERKKEKVKEFNQLL